MRKIILAVAAIGTLGAGVMAETRTSQAGYYGADYPWCARYSGKIGATSCSFFTFQQCLADVSGVGGFCQENPSYIGPPPVRYAVHSRRHHHRHYY